MNWEKTGRIIATIGLIVLLILGAWGIIVLAFSAPAFLSNLSGFFGSDTPDSTDDDETPGLPEALTLRAASSTVPSGGLIELSWTNENAGGPRGYLITYACQDGLVLEAPMGRGDYRPAPCNNGFNYTNASSDTTLRARLSGNIARQAVITVSAISLATGTTTASATVSVTVTPRLDSRQSPSTSGQGAKKPAAPSSSSGQAKPKATSSTYTSNTPRSSYAGHPDLSVRIESAGPGWVRFNIQNKGTKTVPAGWQFTAAIPYANQSYPYTSALQPSITPGSGIIFTLTWNPQPHPYDHVCTLQYPNPDLPAQAGCPPPYPHHTPQTVTVTVDPYNRTADYNRGNNVATVGI